jgi:hypothetical protein
VKREKTENDKQRYLCQNQDCPEKTFILDYTYKGYLHPITHKSKNRNKINYIRKKPCSCFC